MFLVEREEPDGSWRHVTHWEGTVQDGKCRMEWRPPVPPPHSGDRAPGELIHCQFEDGSDLSGAQTAWLVAHCSGLEGEVVELVLEREQGENQWVAIGNAVSTVKAGRARGGIPLASG